MDAPDPSIAAGAPTRPRFAYFGHPHHGGTYTVFRSLRAGLAPFGIDVEWIGVGTAAWRAWSDPAWAEDRNYGEPAGPDADPDAPVLAAALADAVVTRAFDGVFVGVLTSAAEMAAVKDLPTAIRRVMIVHNITPGTYAAARALRDHVHASVAVSPRIQRDLIQRHGFVPERCVTILHGIHPSVTSIRSDADGPVRLVYLGRVEDDAKGVFWLPRIMARLGDGYRLTVAGDGPDLAELRRRCAALTVPVEFLGMIDPVSVPSVLASHDMLLAPSRYEGFCLTLIEAMASGCIPIAARIPGVTDAIVDHGRNGMLFPVGSVAAAVRSVRAVADRERRRAMAARAQQAVTERFTIEAMGQRYHALLAGIVESAPALPRAHATVVAPRDWSALRRFCPRPMKNFLRTVRERTA